MSDEQGKLNGEAKVLFEHLNQQREEDKKEQNIWRRDHDLGSRDFRNEIKEDIADIWKAMRDGFDKITEAILNKPALQPGVDIKTVIGIAGFLLTIITFIGVSLSSQSTALKAEIYRMEHSNNSRSSERHTEQADDINNLDVILQREMRLLDVDIAKQVDQIHLDSRLEIQRSRAVDEQVFREISTLKERTTNLKEFLSEKSKDRFTGSEGKMIQKQIDRLESRMDIISKGWIEHSAEEKVKNYKGE